MTAADRAKMKAVALEALASGQSARDVARALRGEVSKSTVANWAREAAPSIAERAAAIAANVSPDAPPVDDIGAAPSADKLRKMISACWKRGDAAERAGNYTAAQRAAQTASDLMNTLVRVERLEVDDADTLRIARRDIDARRAKLLDVVRAIADRPLLCAACSRALAADFGKK